MAKYKLLLQRFAEGGGDGAGTASSGAEGAGAVTGDNLVDAAQGTVEESPDDGETTTDTAEQRKAEWEKLVNEDYKDLYHESVETIVKNRLGDVKNLQSQIEKTSPIVDALCKKYGCDVEGLQKAIEEDDSFYEAAALERGLSVEQYKEVAKIERENEQLRRAAEEREQIEQGNRIWSNWMQQAEGVKEIYPQFDLRAEANNPQLISLLNSGIDVKTAFQAIHHEEIMSGMMEVATRKAVAATANNIGARNKRPAENGSNSQAVATKKYDVNKMTKAEMDELASRAARGEVITL